MIEWFSTRAYALPVECVNFACLVGAEQEDMERDLAQSQSLAHKKSELGAKLRLTLIVSS